MGTANRAASLRLVLFRATCLTRPRVYHTFTAFRRRYGIAIPTYPKLVTYRRYGFCRLLIIASAASGRRPTYLPRGEVSAVSL